MKTKQRGSNSGGALRRIFQRRDRMLVLNMSIFNFSDGWSRTFAKYEYTRSYA
jgi:hypothetical protein